MTVIIGLGNPGKKYNNTRHNVGFMVLDQLAKKIPADFVLAKTKTFMNLSGRAVKNIMQKYKLPAQNLVVIHDDIDLPLGKIRIVKNRGAAGHKGVESIIKELKTKNFVRFRVGIQPKKGRPKNPEKFVLQEFNKEEEKILKETIKKTAGAVEFFLDAGLEKTMSEFNK